MASTSSVMNRRRQANLKIRCAAFHCNTHAYKPLASSSSSLAVANRLTQKQSSASEYCCHYCCCYYYVLSFRWVRRVPRPAIDCRLPGNGVHITHYKYAYASSESSLLHTHTNNTLMASPSHTAHSHTLPHAAKRTSHCLAPQNYVFSLIFTSFAVRRHTIFFRFNFPSALLRSNLATTINWQPKTNRLHLNGSGRLSMPRHILVSLFYFRRLVGKTPIVHLN